MTPYDCSTTLSGLALLSFTRLYVFLKHRLYEFAGRRSTWMPGLCIAMLGWSIHALQNQSLLCASETTPVTRSTRLVTPHSLAQLIDAHWIGTDLRSVAEQISKQIELPVIIDRRLDPGTPVNLRADAEPAVDLLERLAKSLGVSLSVLHSSVRLAPETVARQMETAEILRDRDIQSLAPSSQTRFSSRAVLQWPIGAVPSEVVESLAEEQNLIIDNLTLIPHDHFPAITLPLMTLAERLDLLLGHFDLCISITMGDDATHISLVPLEDRQEIVRVYRRPLRNSAATARLNDLATSVTIENGETDDFFLLRGSVADARLVERALFPAATVRPVKKPASDPQQDRFTLRVAAPLEELFVEVAGRLKLKLIIDRDSLARASIDPQEVIRLELSNATREQLLDAMTRHAGLSWSIADQTLSIRATSMNPNNSDR